MRLRSIPALLRVGQWTKNGFIVLPAFFAGAILHTEVLVQLILGFIIYSIAASAIYIVNDLRDIEVDRLHPRKRNRPIAAGLVKPGVALVIAILLGSGALAAAFVLDRDFGLIVAGYTGMNLMYSLYLKRWAILDVMIIAFGFLLRLHAGGILADVPISMWIELLTFLLALFIALGKRRDDVLVATSTGSDLRRNIRGYNLEMLNASMALIASVTVMTYIMYTVSPDGMERLGSRYLYYTSFFVLIGMLRYLQLALVKHRTGSPTRLVYEDWPLQVIILAWGASFALIIYAN